MPKVQQHRPCPHGFRRIDIPPLLEERYVALYDFLIEQIEKRERVRARPTIGLQPKLTTYYLVVKGTGFRVADEDYEFFRNFPSSRDFVIETNADDETLIWFRMRYL